MKENILHFIVYKAYYFKILNEWSLSGKTKENERKIDTTQGKDPWTLWACKQYNPNFIVNHKILLHSLLEFNLYHCIDPLMTRAGPVAQSLEGWALSFPLIYYNQIIFIVIWKFIALGWIKFSGYRQGKNLTEAYIKHSEACLW